MTRILKQITWARWRYHDPYESQYFTVFTATIPRPSFEFPIACAMMSVSNAKGRVFIRFATLQALRAVFGVPAEYVERLETGYRTALQEAGKIQTQLKTLMQIGNIPPGAQIVNASTGEVLVEAEKIREQYHGET